jgi:hypothetical protein
MEPVSFLHRTTPSPAILVVVYGIGITKSAYNAQAIGYLTLIRPHACLSLINANQTTIPEPVLHATRVMISETDHASSPPSITLIPLIPDVLYGIGILKYAFSALVAMFSTP